MLEEKKRKKKIAEELEKIDTLGQDSEKKAVKWIKEVDKERIKEEKETESQEISSLTSKKKQVVTYKEELARILYKRLVKNVWPKGYRFIVNVTPKGLEVHIRNQKNKWYGKGISVTFMPEYDLNAAVILVLQADNTLAVSEKLAKESHGKITPL